MCQLPRRHPASRNGEPSTFAEVAENESGSELAWSVPSTGADVILALKLNEMTYDQYFIILVFGFSYEPRQSR